jgi:hypothetical protein
MTLPSCEDVAWARHREPQAAASSRDISESSGVIRVPLNPILCRDWLSDLPLVSSHSRTKYILHQEVLYCATVDPSHRFSGKGCFKYPNNKVFKGEFKDGARHGPGIEWIPETRFFAEDTKGEFGSMHIHIGHWDHNVRQGPGTRFFSNGSVYEGDYRAGVPHGRGVLVTPNGMTYEGEWVGGMMCGQGTSCWKDDRRYRGEWKSGHCHGLGTMRWPDDTVYHGQFEAGVMHGEGVLTTSTGMVLEGTWRNGRRCGTGRVRNVDGTVYGGDWEGNIDDFEPEAEITEKDRGPISPSRTVRQRIARMFRGSNDSVKETRSPRAAQRPDSSSSHRHRSPKSSERLIVDAVPTGTPDTRLPLFGEGTTFGAMQAFADPAVNSEVLAIWTEARQPIRLDRSELLGKIAHIPIPEGPAIPVEMSPESFD